MNIVKKPYEISIWKDVLMYVGTPIEGKTSPTSNLADLSSVDYQYYDEARLATIGSDVMTSPARAVNSVFKKNINGTETLTFDMYYQYEDIESGELVRNPLIDLVIDERKVKLYYEDQWYDFIVKKDDEKGRDYKYSYTCTGLAANELGKTGFNIELDTELENNMGTVQELGASVLQGSDWQLAQEGQEIIQQTNEEALYSLVLTSAITTAKKLDGTSFGSNIPVGARIYAYYTPYMNQEKDYFQFIYVNGDTGTLVPDLLEDKITIYCNDTRTYDLYVSNVTWTNERPDFATGNPTVAQYRGLRYVRKQLSTYDPVLEQTVLKYTRNNTEYYGYTTTSYIDTTTVQNYIYNSVNFAGTSYWGIYGNSSSKSIKAEVFPSVKVSNTDLERAGYLVAQFGNTAARLMNEGIVQNYSRINIFTKGEKYRLRIKVGTVSGDSFTPLTGSNLPFNCIVKKYKLVDVDTPAEDVIYFNSSDSSTVTTVDSDDYTILDMECLNSATWRELKDTVGVFFSLKVGSDTKYYIKDVQFYKYIVGKNGVIVAPDDPVENLPDVRIETKYHFYDPAQNIGKLIPEDYIFSEEDPSLYTPLYGTGESEFEKVRSITAKESNRFNLLQELSETFECWVRFEVEHETNGRISIEEFDYYDLVNLAEGASTTGYYIYDWYNKQYVAPTEQEAIKGQKYYQKVSRRRQVKKVIFYKEILVDNYAGFKYGINLKDNNRTLDSEQIVTKIIVKDNTCDQAENGFCSIARAVDNPIKENFAYNFDYFTSHGIIDQSTLNNDLYLEINGSIGLYPRLSRLNKERNSLIDSAAPLANSIDDLNSKYQVAVLEYNAAEKELQRMKDPQSGTIYQYTHYRYEDFYNQIGRVEGNANVPSYADEIYYIKTGSANLTITSDSGNLLYVIHTSDVTPQSGKTYYYISGSKFVLFASTKFRDTAEYYEQVGAQGTTGTYFQTAATTIKLTFTGTSSTDEVYIYGAARRRIPDLGDEDYIDDNFTISTLEKITTQEANKTQAQEEMEHYGADLETTQAQYDSIQDQLKTIANATDEVEKEFNVKYARYIQEGSWTDDNYMDDDLYYLDSLAVLYQSAYPKVSYNFSVIDLSQLEDYELYKFDIGHKTYVEDVEFFGYQIVGGLKTPVREQVVVTEESLYLDEPDKNQLKVQNYKSHFEDLFQRITAATQTLEYHSGEYGRAAVAVTSNGEVSQTVMQKTLANSSYVITNSRDQSITWDDTGLQAINLGDPLQITRLASAGLLVSADGGQTWGVAISGYGINTNYLTAGVIDADNINIMSGAYPTFRWDSSGLNAYGFTTDSQGNILNYDPTRFVNYSRFGLYGVNGLLNPDIDSLEDIENSAAFALTWNGLFMRAQHRDGFVRVSPTEDFAVYQTVIENNTNTDVLRGKFGLIGEDSTSGEEIFGLALYKQELDEYNQPIPTVLTQSDGTLWLLDSMRIGTPTQTNTIYIGVGEVDTTPGANRYKVINVNDNNDQEKFVVYSDGTLKASGVNIEGYINATSGQIGNMTVDGIQETVGVRIQPGNTEFKYNGSSATPASMTFNVAHGLTGTITYKWYLYNNISQIDSHQILGATGNSYTYTFNSADFNNGITYLKVKVFVDENLTTEIVYSDRITLSYVVDGEDGVTISSIEYGISNSADTQPSSWSSSVPSNIQPGQWLWTKTTYDDTPPTIVYTKAYNGENGQDGAPGHDGAPGQDGEDGAPGISYTYAINSSLGNIINIDNLPSGTSATTITGHIYMTVGGASTEEITGTNWVWYYQKNNTGNFTQLTGATTNSFSLDLVNPSIIGAWDSLKFYFTASVDVDVLDVDNTGS